MNKFLCQSCDAPLREDEVLHAPNPFDPDWKIQGCPKCLEVNSLVVACEADSCFQEVTCGFPTPTGYMRTCGKHYREFGNV